LKLEENGVEVNVEITKVPKTHKENLMEKRMAKIVAQRKEIKSLLYKNWQLEQRISRIKHFLTCECKRI